MLRKLLAGLLAFHRNEWGAVTVTTVFDGADTFIADIEADADADTTATIPHTLAAIPQEVYVTPLQQVAAAISEWAATTIDATNVVLTKGTGAGSGVAGNQVRCIIKRPHTLGR